VLGDAVGELVPDDIDPRRGLGKDAPITVTEEHVTGAIPERIGVLPPVMHQAE
jgi:hypothetical protein